MCKEYIKLRIEKTNRKSIPMPLFTTPLQLFSLFVITLMSQTNSLTPTQYPKSNRDDGLFYRDVLTRWSDISRTHHYDANESEYSNHYPTRCCPGVDKSLFSKGKKR